MEKQSVPEILEQDTSVIRRTNLRRMRGRRSAVAIERERKLGLAPSPQSPPKEGDRMPVHISTPLCWGEDLHPASDDHIKTPAATQRENSRRLLQLLIADPDASPIRKHFGMEKRKMTDTPISRARWEDMHALMYQKKQGTSAEQALALMAAVADDIRPQGPLLPPFSPVTPVANCSPEL